MFGFVVHFLDTSCVVSLFRCVRARPCGPLFFNGMCALSIADSTTLTVGFKGLSRSKSGNSLLDGEPNTVNWHVA